MTGQELNLTRADTSMTPHEFGFFTSPFPLYPLMQLISTVSQQNQGIFRPLPPQCGRHISNALQF